MKGKDEFLGRTVCKPMVKSSPNDPRTCILQWHQLTNQKGDAGELLASFELFLVSVRLMSLISLTAGTLTQPPPTNPTSSQNSYKLSYQCGNLYSIILKTVSSTVAHTCMS